jgi:hypothetical protein
MTLWILLLPSAWSHAGDRIDGIDLQILGSGLVSVESSVGVIWAEDEETLSWHCHEAITAERRSLRLGMM